MYTRLLEVYKPPLMLLLNWEPLVRAFLQNAQNRKNWLVVSQINELPHAEIMIV